MKRILRVWEKLCWACRADPSQVVQYPLVCNREWCTYGVSSVTANMDKTDTVSSCRLWGKPSGPLSNELSQKHVIFYFFSYPRDFYTFNISQYKTCTSWLEMWRARLESMEWKPSWRSSLERQECQCWRLRLKSCFQYEGPLLGQKFKKQTLVVYYSDTQTCENWGKKIDDVKSLKRGYCQWTWITTYVYSTHICIRESCLIQWLYRKVWHAKDIPKTWNTSVLAGRVPESQRGSTVLFFWFTKASCCT